MKKKKLLAVIVSCFVIAMLCTGCGEDDEADVPVNDVAESTESEASTTDDDSIVGTWAKQTGVCYTFEPDGHMSVSIPGEYDKSGGSSLDGSEVTSLLNEINTFGHISSGGTWSYKYDHDGEPVYSIFYMGSNFECLKTTAGENQYYLIMVLESGMGDASYLYPID